MRELKWQTTKGLSKTTLPNSMIEIIIELGNLQYKLSCPVLGVSYTIPTSDIIPLQRLKVLALRKVASALETLYKDVTALQDPTETHLPWLK